MSYFFFVKLAVFIKKYEQILLHMKPVGGKPKSLHLCSVNVFDANSLTI